MRSLLKRAAGALPVEVQLARSSPDWNEAYQQLLERAAAGPAPGRGEAAALQTAMRDLLDGFGGCAQQSVERVVAMLAGGEGDGEGPPVQVLRAGWFLHRGLLRGEELGNLRALQARGERERRRGRGEVRGGDERGGEQRDRGDGGALLRGGFHGIIARRARGDGAARRAVRLRVRVMGSSGERRSRVGETGRDARAGKAARGELGAGRTFAVATRGATPTKAEQPRRAAIVRAT